MTDYAQAILNKAPPGDMEKNVKYLKETLSGNADAVDALSKKFPLPFKVLDSSDGGERPFLLCRYNKVGDKHRSPWTNKLHPDGGDAVVATDNEDLRSFEMKMNEVWDAYKNLYYGHDSVGSVFLQESGEKGSGAFTGVFGIHKDCKSGMWDSLHLVQVEAPTDKMCNYKVESFVLTTAKPEIPGTEGSDEEKTTSMEISANMTKEKSQACKIQKSQLQACHIENIGKLIEGNEIDMRSSMERVYAPKTQEILDDIQKKSEGGGGSKMPTAVNPLMGMMMQSAAFKKKQQS